MQRLLDIRAAENRRYRYSLAENGEAVLRHGAGMGSIEACLKDAATALEDGFSHVQISFEGTRLGSFLAQRLARQPDDVADELMRGLMKSYAASVA